MALPGRHRWGGGFRWNFVEAPNRRRCRFYFWLFSNALKLYGSVFHLSEFGWQAFLFVGVLRFEFLRYIEETKTVTVPPTSASQSPKLAVRFTSDCVTSSTIPIAATKSKRNRICAGLTAVLTDKRKKRVINAYARVCCTLSRPFICSTGGITSGGRWVRIRTTAVKATAMSNRFMLGTGMPISSRKPSWQWVFRHTKSTRCRHNECSCWLPTYFLNQYSQLSSIRTKKTCHSTFDRENPASHLVVVHDVFGWPAFERWFDGRVTIKQTQYRNRFSLVVEGFDVVFDDSKHSRKWVILKEPFELRQRAFQVYIALELTQQRQRQAWMVRVDFSGMNVRHYFHHTTSSTDASSLLWPRIMNCPNLYATSAWGLELDDMPLLCDPVTSWDRLKFSGSIARLRDLSTGSPSGLWRVPMKIGLSHVPLLAFLLCMLQKDAR